MGRSCLGDAEEMQRDFVMSRRTSQLYVAAWSFREDASKGKITLSVGVYIFQNARNFNELSLGWCSTLDWMTHKIVGV
jgi:hypothetical protein